jgi:hypothetical protein
MQESPYRAYLSKTGVGLLGHVDSIRTHIYSKIVVISIHVNIKRREKIKPISIKKCIARPKYRNILALNNQFIYKHIVTTTYLLIKTT